MFRIGLFDPICTYINDVKEHVGPTPISTRLVAGFVSGSLGAWVCNPFELVKTRIRK